MSARELILMRALREAAPTSSRALLYRAALLSALATLASCSSGGGSAGPASARAAPGPSASASSGSETTLTGYVLRLNKADTIRVSRAAVWTVPASDEVLSDSTGAWTINAGLSQRQYRVWASSEDVKGHTAPIPAKVSQTVDGIVVMLGADETAWPPDILFQKLVPKANRGPGQVRCCN